MSAQLEPISMLQRILTISLLVSAPVFGQQADQQATQTKSNAKVLLDNWTIMQMAGAPVGYIHTLVTETGTGESRVIKTATRTRLKIKRLGSMVSIDQDSDTFHRRLSSRLPGGAGRHRHRPICGMDRGHDGVPVADVHAGLPRRPPGAERDVLRPHRPGDPRQHGLRDVHGVVLTAPPQPT